MLIESRNSFGISGGGGGTGWAVTGTTTLTGDATIDADGHSLLIQNGAAGIGLDPDNITVGADGGSIQISPTDVTISLGIGATFVYNADYSADYTDRSLVDKGWVVDNSLPLNLTSLNDGDILVYDLGSDTWINEAIPIGATVAGSNTQIQYNNSGSFGATSRFVYTEPVAGRPNLSLIGDYPTMNLNYGASNTAGALWFVGPSSIEGALVASNTYDMYLYLGGQGSGSPILYMKQSNNCLGVGVVTSPTATVHIAAGTTAKAQIRLNTGVAPSSPNDGDIWREDNTNTGLKYRVNGVTKTIVLV